VSEGEQRLLVAIPALNEAAVVDSVVREVLRVVPSGSAVVVVDDGSTDGTASVASRAGAMVVSMPYNVGVGGAMRAAFLFAVRNGYSLVAQVDADGQHDASQLPALLARLGEHDVVIGARFAGVGSYDVRGPRRWAMSVLAAALSRITGTRLTDVTSGFRVAGPRAVRLFAFEYPSEYLGDTVESLVIAHRAGLSVSQIGVEMRPRQAGVPSQGRLRSTIYLARAVLMLVLALVRDRPETPPTDHEAGAQGGPPRLSNAVQQP
jgi:glycosyltransferase involved in cell wall biosynthesis